MHIVRWLMGHPIVSAWILAILAILLNWGVGGRSHEGMGEQQAAHATEQHQVAEAGHEGAGQTAAEGSAQQVAATGEAMTENHGEASANAGGAGEQATATEQQAAAGTSAGGEAVAEQGATEQQVTSAGGEGTAVVAAAVATVASASVAEQAANTSAQAQPAEASQAAAQATVESDTPENLLLAAREAYWSGELDRSVEFYQSLLKKDDKADYKGELANVYWKQGKSAEAVALYAEIAPWLAQQGRVAELNSIKVYADLVDAAKGAEIGALIK